MLRNQRANQKVVSGMCGIAGAFNPDFEPIPELERKLGVMDHLLRHRGPDGHATWLHEKRHVGLEHRRLDIIDLNTGDQPMSDEAGNHITYNGEIYNFIELRKELGENNFRTTSDTEVILRAYLKWGNRCVEHFRGMFAFAIWDERRQELFCARDRMGIKPFYYARQHGTFYFASEPKALLPFLPDIETNFDALKDYLTFQFTLAGKTLFNGVDELAPAHTLSVSSKGTQIQRYWEVYYTRDFNRTAEEIEASVDSVLDDAVRLHLRSDVPVGAYISGGLDSSLIASLASHYTDYEFIGFTGKFPGGPTFDESKYAEMAAKHSSAPLQQVEITESDFIQHIRDVIYHLDQPVAGVGSFPQYVVSELASQHRKVVLGGQGGDEIFGGYARYLVAYLEQVLRGAIEGKQDNAEYIVTIESIIPNLSFLENYKPMLREFWADGLFGPMDERYFKLVNRSPMITDEVDWEQLGPYSPFETFLSIFNADNVEPGSYFDNMTHFDVKTLLPALLHVEDRMSMAHGLEARVPLLDHKLVELAATIPSNVKFKHGTMKRVLRDVAREHLPAAIVDRKDKMGFPVPFRDWFNGQVGEFILDVFNSKAARSRGLINNPKVAQKLSEETQFGRTVWGFLSLELWQQEFHDKAGDYKAMLSKEFVSLV